ncbi:hypothetical protein M407DRAFT_241714 [Tulasnella calospora MUT 4182]|uniref:Uncharacterized protein n=1 Tax=Tulasnella calospora MUT 4182 TaxID=1051891 RepID=A0A0C3QRY8_9AGAM|nr:hypothetical protein M407DRAFT_241714 [Tulasnella calospora MUT 4182]
MPDGGQVSTGGPLPPIQSRCRDLNLSYVDRTWDQNLQRGSSFPSLERRLHPTGSSQHES